MESIRDNNEVQEGGKQPTRGHRVLRPRTQKEQPVQRCDGSHEPIINMLALLRAYTDMLLNRTRSSSLGGSNVLTAGKSARNLDSHSCNL